jgi:GntR family transcriptional regulator, transcriptional repressor for pyruvate dehydrogenase complex
MQSVSDYLAEGGRAMPARRVRKTSELIARDLALEIVENELPEGTALPTEHEMIERFQVGRTTMREALRILETRGVIKIKPGRTGGPIVLRPRSENLSEALALVLQFEGASLSDVLLARQALEPMIYGLAAEHISDGELGLLRTHVEAMRAQASGGGWLARHAAFHTAIAHASGSIVLRVFSDSLISIFDGAEAGVTYSTRRRQAALASHQAILDALGRRDRTAAEAASAEHVAEIGRYWKSRYPSLFTSPVRWMHGEQPRDR